MKIKKILILLVLLTSIRAIYASTCPSGSLLKYNSQTGIYSYTDTAGRTWSDKYNNIGQLNGAIKWNNATVIPGMTQSFNNPVISCTYFSVTSGPALQMLVVHPLKIKAQQIGNQWQQTPGVQPVQYSCNHSRTSCAFTVKK